MTDVWIHLYEVVGERPLDEVVWEAEAVDQDLIGPVEEREDVAAEGDVVVETVVEAEVYEGTHARTEETITILTIKNFKMDGMTKIDYWDYCQICF